MVDFMVQNPIPEPPPGEDLMSLIKRLLAALPAGNGLAAMQVPAPFVGPIREQALPPPPIQDQPFPVVPTPIPNAPPNVPPPTPIPLASPRMERPRPILNVRATPSRPQLPVAEMPSLLPPQAPSSLSQAIESNSEYMPGPFLGSAEPSPAPEPPQRPSLQSLSWLMRRPQEPQTDQNQMLAAVSKILEETYPDSLEKVLPRYHAKKESPLITLLSDFSSSLMGENPAALRHEQHRQLDDQWRADAKYLLGRREALGSLKLKALEDRMKAEQTARENKRRMAEKLFEKYPDNPTISADYLRASGIPEDQVLTYMMDHYNPETGRVEFAPPDYIKRVQSDQYEFLSKYKLYKNLMPDATDDELFSWVSKAPPRDLEKVAKNKLLDPKVPLAEKMQVEESLKRLHSLNQKDNIQKAMEFSKVMPMLIREGRLDPRKGQYIFDSLLAGKGLPDEFYGIMQDGEKWFKSEAAKAMQGDAGAVAKFKSWGMSPKDVFAPKEKEAAAEPMSLIISSLKKAGYRDPGRLLSEALAQKQLQIPGKEILTLVQALRTAQADWIRKYESVQGAPRLTDDKLLNLMLRADQLGYLPDPLQTAKEAIELTKQVK